MEQAFSSAYDKFILHHLANASPARASRIAGGLGYVERLFLETVWWPTFRHFDGISPQHEVRDYDDGFRYIDFAYHLPHARVAIEIDGFGPHWRDISQEQFAANCRRQNMLILDEWRVLRFAFVDVRLHLTSRVDANFSRGSRITIETPTFHIAIGRARTDLLAGGSNSFKVARSSEFVQIV
ncbi:MAG: hypothetical protein OWU32_01540 [Firmicutes bacterium]|nr:hypothetical protein [Bacillota bacterium]